MKKKKSIVNIRGDGWDRTWDSRTQKYWTSSLKECHISRYNDNQSHEDGKKAKARNIVLCRRLFTTARRH